MAVSPGTAQSLIKELYLMGRAIRVVLSHPEEGQLHELRGIGTGEEGQGAGSGLSCGVGEGQAGPGATGALPSPSGDRADDICRRRVGLEYHPDR